MRILASSLTYPLLNGVTASLNMSVDGFKSAGHEIRIVAPEYSCGKIRPEHFPVPSSFLSRVFLSFFGKKERTFGIWAKRRIAEIVHNFQPDAFWLHTIAPFPTAFEKYIVDSEKPKALSYHTLVEQYGRIYGGPIGAELMRKRSRDIANRMDAVIVPGGVIEKRLQEYGVKKPIHIIHTGIEIPKILFDRREIAGRHKFSPEAIILLYVGRVAKEKNINALIRTVSDLKKLGANAILLIVGPGDIAETKKITQKKGINDRVFFTGPLPREEAQGYYGGADIFLFASRTETQGLVIGEAMLAGVPVVALDSPIRNEFYPEGMAVVVQKEEDFAPSVLRVIHNAREKGEMAEAAGKFAREMFSKEQMIKSQIALFENIINRR